MREKDGQRTASGGLDLGQDGLPPHRPRGKETRLMCTDLTAFGNPEGTLHVYMSCAILR